MNVTKEGGSNPHPTPIRLIIQPYDKMSHMRTTPRRHREFVAVAINRFCAFRPWRRDPKKSLFDGLLGLYTFFGACKAQVRRVNGPRNVMWI
jgi:hypothetical protein